jgi:outer membrane protein assembly factor BamB
MKTPAKEKMMNRTLTVSLAVLAGCLTLSNRPLTSASAGGQAPRASQASGGGQPREIPPLRLIQQIPLPNVLGRIDHFTMDVKRHRLILSALGNSTVEIVDVYRGRVIHTITGLSVPQGVLYVPENDRILVANEEDGAIRVYDGTSFALVKTIKFTSSDAIRYDSRAKRIYVGYGEDEDGAIGVIDAVTYERLPDTYKTGGGHPEAFQVESSGSKIFVNDPDAGDVTLSIDRKTGAVAKWGLAGNRFNFPEALDEANHRLFVGTRRPSKLIVFDTETGKLVAALPCAGDSDDMFFDARRKRVYVIGGAGGVSVFQQKDADHYSLLAEVASSIGARTGWYYSTAEWDRLYVAVPSHGGQGAELWVYETQD